MSNVSVRWLQRSVTIKTTPGKPLSEIRSEACAKFGLSTPTGFLLKGGGTKLDLSLPVRLANFVPGTKLELVQVSTSPVAKPVTIVLRTVDSVEQLSGTFLSSTTILAILKKLEADARAAGGTNVNITERCAPSSEAGSGRLLYQMPAVRVANRELAKIEELGQTLEELGCSGRELLVLRFLPTTIPYEDALMEIAKITKDVDPETVKSPKVPAKEEVKPAANSTEDEDLLLPKTSDTSKTSAIPETSDIPETSETPKTANISISTKPSETVGRSPEPSVVQEPARTVEPKVAVYQPSSSTIPAAATFEVPDAAYDIGIAELKRIKQNYHLASQPQRLLSDKELAEKEAIKQQEMEKIQSLKVKVRFPDGYISQQELDGKCTARDLYTLIRTTLRHPNEPFVLLIPPREVIKDDARRLTVDLKLRTGASLHLSWGKNASDKAKNSPALNDDLVKASKELPKLAAPNESDYVETEEESEKAKGKRKEEAGPRSTKSDIEKKLKGLLRLGRK